MEKDLKKITKINKNIRCKLIGYILEEDPVTEMDGDVIVKKTFGVIMLFFKDEDDNILFTRTTDFENCTIEKPLGDFTEHISKLQEWFNINVDKKGVFTMEDVLFNS